MTRHWAKPKAKSDQKHHINLQGHDLRRRCSPTGAKQCVEYEVADRSDDCSGKDAATERHQEFLATDELLDFIWTWTLSPVILSHA